MKPCFITLEGGEGAGKTTLIHFITDWLQGQNREVVVSREPGGTRLGEDMRKLVLASQFGELDKLSEALLVFAARAQHLREVIRPALASGKDVVCDRFTDASYAYQGAGRKLGDETIRTLEQLVHPELQPDLTLLLDLPVAQGMRRALSRGDPDRIEQEQNEFFERVRSAYLQRADKYPERFVIINAQLPVKQVQEQVAAILEETIA